MKRLIIYGDIHGCLDEFSELRKMLEISKEDEEVCVGDVISKGYNSLGVLDFLMQYDIKSVLGNHEDKFIRYFEHEKNEKTNPVKLTKDEKSILENLEDRHIKYLQKMPLFLRYGNITIIHGGIKNDTDLNDISKRLKQQIIRLRYLDSEGNFVSIGKNDESSIFWSDAYDGHEGFVIFGHQHFWNIKQSKYAVGIDTGCVYGNKLSAVIFPDFNDETTYFFKSVLAKKVYIKSKSMQI